MQNTNAPTAACLRLHHNEKIKKAEVVLKKYTKDPACVPPLLQQMRSSQHEQARQVASIILKKKLVGHWKSFNDQQKVRERERERRETESVCVSEKEMSPMVQTN